MGEEQILSRSMKGKTQGTENAIASAIRSGGKIKYTGSENPLQDQYLRIVGMQAACRFLATVGEWDLDNLPMSGLSAICGLMAKELDAIGGELDSANAEICRAVNGEPICTPEGVQP